jgi:hypothetical protein
MRKKPAKPEITPAQKKQLAEMYQALRKHFSEKIKKEKGRPPPKS